MERCCPASETRPPDLCRQYSAWTSWSAAPPQSATDSLARWGRAKFYGTSSGSSLLLVKFCKNSKKTQAKQNNFHDSNANEIMSMMAFWVVPRSLQIMFAGNSLEVKSFRQSKILNTRGVSEREPRGWNSFSSSFSQWNYTMTGNFGQRRTTNFTLEETLKRSKWELLPRLLLRAKWGFELYSWRLWAFLRCTVAAKVFLRYRVLWRNSNDRAITAMGYWLEQSNNTVWGRNEARITMI